MTTKRKFFVVMMLMTSIVVFNMSCKKDKNVNPDNNYIQDEKIKNNVVVIDEQIANLLSDSLQQIEGEYIFEYSEIPPTFQTGDIIVGLTGIGYLRKVVIAEASGNTVILQTQQATLEDVFVSSQLNVDMQYTASKKTLKTYLSQGVVQNKNESINLSLSDYKIYSANGVDVTLVNASINIIPNFVYTHNYEDGTFQSVSVISKNTPIELDYNLAINGTLSTIATTEKVLFEKSQIYITPTLVPVIICINHKIKVVLKPSVDVGIDYNYREIQKYNYDIGLEYANGSFNTVLVKNSSSENVINNSLKVRADGNLKVSFIYEPTVFIYGIQGTYLVNKINGTISGSTNESEDWNFSLDIDGSATAGIDFSIFRDGYDIMENTQELFNKRLYTSPDTVFMVLGNNQTGSINTPLADSIKVRITDNLGFGTPNVKVYFIPHINNGTVANEFVYTNSNGYAYTVWTPGNTEGDQELKVLVKNANGSYIKNIPLTFKATVEGNTFTDPRDGKVYNKVTIGAQTWFAENLNYTTGIPNVTSDAAWAQLANNNTDAAWCYYDNNSDYGETYGVLYTYAAALTACPTGWHLPSNAEWTTLMTYLGGEDIAGGKMKEAGTEHWRSPNTDATNSSGFTGLPGSQRSQFGGFYYIEFNGCFWSVSEYNSTQSWAWLLNYNDGELDSNYGSKKFGSSVRCLRN